MNKKLQPIGGGLALVIDPAQLAALHITADTPLDVQIEGGALVIRPAADVRAARLAAATDALMDLHDDTLRRLAQ
jgi:antitoxin component of MazEF toxin-antitoxin module